MAAHPDSTASPLDRHDSPVAARKDGRALTAMILGIVSIPMTFVIGIIGLIMAIVAIILGVIANRDVRGGSSGQAITGIICGVASIAVFIIAVVVIAANN